MEDRSITSESHVKVLHLTALSSRMVACRKVQATPVSLMHKTDPSCRSNTAYARLPKFGHLACFGNMAASGVADIDGTLYPTKHLERVATKATLLGKCSSRRKCSHRAVSKGMWRNPPLEAKFHAKSRLQAPSTAVQCLNSPDVSIRQSVEPPSIDCSLYFLPNHLSAATKSLLHASQEPHDQRG